MCRDRHMVYVLWSDEGERFYIGLTSDVDRRLAQHNEGISKWTRRYAGSWQLAWQCDCESLKRACQLERKLKRQKGGDGFWHLTGLRKGDFKKHPGS